MIEVDISHIWSGISLPEFLAIEKDVAAAHSALWDTEENRPAWVRLPRRKADEEILRLLTTAETIRSQSEICVVVGWLPGARAVLEMLQGIQPHPGMNKGNPQLLFAGDSLSPREWEALLRQLEGRDYSIFAANPTPEKPETAIAFRGLRWQLERRLGTEEASRRIYVAAPEESPLWNLAQQQHWECFALPAEIDESHSIFTAAALLPLAIAGVNILELLSGAADALENYHLRSFENPLWLYTAVRYALYRKGRNLELFSGFSSGFNALGTWWQQLFNRCGTAVFPVGAQYPKELPVWEHRILGGSHTVFETLIRFAPQQSPYTVTSDISDWDGLNNLAGKQLEDVEQSLFSEVLDRHCDCSLPVITADCGALSERVLGELFGFLALACGICEHIRNENPTGGK